MSLREDFEQHDLLGLAELVRTGQTTPRELRDEVLERIEARNPALNAVTHVAQDVARSTIEEGLPDGPFRGVPYLLKDLYVLHEGMPTTNGSVGIPSCRT